MSNRTTTIDRTAAPVPHAGVAPRKFADPVWTAKGERRAVVPLTYLHTLWLNTGTLCNIACTNCYIESSPKNDALTYLTRADARAFLDEATAMAKPPREIGFTGGEPFMNPDFIDMLGDSLAAGFQVLVLTNAMKPMKLRAAAFKDLNVRFPGRLAVRVSIDHYERARHEAVRGKRTWTPAIEGISWLAANGFDLSLAGRKLWDETEDALRAGYGRLLGTMDIALDAGDPRRLVLFPEMVADADVPEISEGCWSILHKTPDDVMCASSRMIVKRRGAAAPTVIACTLLPYADGFELGATLAEAAGPVSLNHRHCAKFCVLGGASCSPAK